MPTRPVTLSTTPQVALASVPRNIKRVSIAITNKDSSISVAIIDNQSQTFADGTTVPPGATRFYIRKEDGPNRLDRAFIMVAASGTPVVAIDPSEEPLNG